MKVINYTPAYKEKLRNFIRNHFSKQPDEYLDYRLEQITESDEDILYNIIVLDNNDAIIGCNLFFSTKAIINGIEQRIYWSHNTLIDDNHKGDAGTNLVLAIMEKKHFGISLSKYSKKYYKIFKSTFFSKAHIYYFMNIWVIKNMINFLLRRNNKKIFLFPDEVLVNKCFFKRIKKSTELNIPNNGYWWKDVLDIDFIRDDKFLSHRFFENFNTYYFYKLEQKDEIMDECYFVVRPILWRKFNILSIVDFRCNLKNKKQLTLLLKAINHVAKKNHIGVIIMRTNLLITALFKTSKINFNLFHPFFISRNEKIDIVASNHYLFTNNPTLIVTSADSDGDFI